MTETEITKVRQGSGVKIVTIPANSKIEVGDYVVIKKLETETI